MPSSRPQFPGQQSNMSRLQPIAHDHHLTSHYKFLVHNKFKIPIPIALTKRQMAKQSTMISEKEQEVKPLTLPSKTPFPAVAPLPATDEEAIARWSSVQYLRRRRAIFWCCGCWGATVLVFGLIILILAFTLFKVKDPVLTLNNLYLEEVSVHVGTIDHQLLINTTLTADVSIENPNVASFKYGNSTTEFYIEEQTVAAAYAVAGEVGAHKTVTMNVTVEMLVDRVGKTNATENVLNGRPVNVTTFTDINGKVDVWGIYKREIEVMLNCSMSLDITVQAQQIKNKACVAHVR